MNTTTIRLRNIIASTALFLAFATGAGCLQEVAPSLDETAAFETEGHSRRGDKLGVEDSEGLFCDLCAAQGCDCDGDACYNCDANNLTTRDPGMSESLFCDICSIKDCSCDGDSCYDCGASLTTNDRGRTQDGQRDMLKARP